MTLSELGFNSLALHSMISQRERNTALTRFRSNHVKILVATDVASRGKWSVLLFGSFIIKNSKFQVWIFRLCSWLSITTFHLHRKNSKSNLFYFFKYDIKSFDSIIFKCSPCGSNGSSRTWRMCHNVNDSARREKDSRDRSSHWYTVERICDRRLVVISKFNENNNLIVRIMSRREGSGQDPDTSVCDETRTGD